MEEKYSIIVMEKVVVDDFRNFFIFKPINIVSGTLKDEKFIDEDGNYHTLITNRDINDPDIKYGVGFPILDSFLSESMPGFDIEDARDAYFFAMSDYLNIGVDMKDLDKVGLMAVNKSDLFENIYMKMLNLRKDGYVQIKNSKTNEKIADIKIEEGFDWIIQYILILVEEMLNSKDITLIKENLEELKEVMLDCLDEINKGNKEELKRLPAPRNEEVNMEKKTQQYYDEFAKDLNEIKDPLDFDYLEVYNMIVSKIIDRDEQIDSILTTIKETDKTINKNKKPALLIAGTTGTGKTQTFTELSRALGNRPVVIVDTNQLTQEGYVGGTIEKNILGHLISEAMRINSKDGKGNTVPGKKDIELAQRGIVLLDEIDKRAEKGSSDNVNCGAVIDQLLKFMDGTIYQVPAGRNESISFDTSDLVVMASGAFQEYFDAKEEEKTNKKGTLGFAIEPTVKKEEQIDLSQYNEVKPEDLAKYGLSSQFIARFNSVVLFPPHSKETLEKLEENKATSNLEVKKEHFKTLGVDLVFQPELISALAEEAYNLKMGGRALNNIVSRCTNKVASELEKRPNEYKIVYIPKEAIKNPGLVTLVRNDGTFIMMKEIKEKTLKVNQQLRELQKININNEALEEVLELLETNEKTKKLTK